MARVGVRELRQNLSKYLDRVKEGESLEVTEHGREVARLVPARANAYAELAAQFGVRAPSERLDEIAARLTGPETKSGATDAFLEETRTDRLA